MVYRINLAGLPFVIKKISFEEIENLALSKGFKWVTSGGRQLGYASGRDNLRFDFNNFILSFDASGELRSYEEVYRKLNEIKKQEQFKAGDWVTIDNTNGGYYGEIGASFRIGRIEAGWIKQDEVSRPYLSEGGCWKPEHLRKATKDEIETTLVAEAKRREYIGKTLAKTGINERFSSLSFRPIKGFVYCPNIDALECYGEGYAYQKGQWAEIVKRSMGGDSYNSCFQRWRLGKGYKVTSDKFNYIYVTLSFAGIVICDKRSIKTLSS